MLKRPPKCLNCFLVVLIVIKLQNNSRNVKPTGAEHIETFTHLFFTFTNKWRSKRFVPPLFVMHRSDIYKMIQKESKSSMKSENISKSNPGCTFNLICNRYERYSIFTNRKRHTSSSTLILIASSFFSTSNFQRSNFTIRASSTPTMIFFTGSSV